jgi:hypothetical protein
MGEQVADAASFDCVTAECHSARRVVVPRSQKRDRGHPAPGCRIRESRGALGVRVKTLTYRNSETPAPFGMLRAGIRLRRAQLKNNRRSFGSAQDDNYIVNIYKQAT